MRTAFVSWRDYYGKLLVFAIRCEGFPPACLRILIEAQVEKEKLAEQAEKGEPEGGEATGEGRTEPRQIPPASFSTLVTTLATQIFLSLGGMEDPKTKQRYVDLDLAKHQIDILVVLEEKTAGNLTDEEKKLLDQVLYETRMQYVNIAQHATRAEPPKNA